MGVMHVPAENDTAGKCQNHPHANGLSILQTACLEMKEEHQYATRNSGLMGR